MKRAKSAVPQPKQSAAAAEAEQHRAVTRETIRAVLKQAKNNDAARRADTWVGMPPPPPHPGREPVRTEAIARAWARHGITKPPPPGTPRRDAYGNLLASG